MVWNRRVETTERFPPEMVLRAYLCSVMGLMPRSLLRIVGGQRSVVAMVWNRRVETTERFPPEMVSRRICAAWSGMRSAKQAQKKVGRKMRPTCVKVLFRWT